MLAAIISMLFATLIAIKVKAYWRFAAFVFSLLVLMPSMAYIVAGTEQVLSEMSGAQVVSDFFSIAKQCYTEPFKLLSPAGEGGLNATFAIVGSVVLISTLIAVGQFFAWLARQNRDESLKQPKAA